MIEPTGHCPYLGLKQNRAIRFSSPTPEHRCYFGGEPSDIPVDQSSYCLSQGHIQCPLYMGLSLATTSDTTEGTEHTAKALHSGVRGWLATLPPRDRTIYTVMIGTLAIIIVVYLLAGIQSLFVHSTTRGTEQATAFPATQTPEQTPNPPPPTSPPTLTDLPTPPPAQTITARPTHEPIILRPTPLATAISPTIDAPTANTPVPIPPSPVKTPTSPTRPPPTTAPPSPTASATPTINTTNEAITLYFTDSTGKLYVPVQRRTPVENRQVANAAIRELIAGPRNGLGRLIVPDAHLLDLRIDSGTAIVNFDRRPTGAGDPRGFYAIVFTLTHFSSIQRVQFQINGQNIGIDGDRPIARPPLNPLNPQGLSNDVRQTEFLPLYFPLTDGQHDVRIIRFVPKTNQTAEATIRALLDGPGEYEGAVRRVIPNNVALRGINIDQGTITVDFTQPFTDTPDRTAAVRTIVESLTTLKTVSGVRILIEGRSLGEWWGGDYGTIFRAPPINAE